MLGGAAREQAVRRDRGLTTTKKKERDLMRLMTAIAGALLLAGCGGGGGVRLASIPADCVATNTITVSYGPGHLSMDNECVVVMEGVNVTLAFMPIGSSPTRAVSTHYKHAGHSWMNKSDDAGRPIPITPDKGSGGGPTTPNSYEYRIKVDGVGVLDPRIVVQ
jgi:hypothetical protein